MPTSLASAASSNKSRKAIADRLSSMQGYVDAHKSKIERYRSKLANADFTPETYHFLFQGHILCGFINRDLFVNLIYSLRKERIAEILSEGSDTQKRQRLTQFMTVTGIKSASYENGQLSEISMANHKKSIRDSLRQIFFYCTDVEKTPLGYSRIKKDLDSLFG